MFSRLPAQAHSLRILIETLLHDFEHMLVQNGDHPATDSRLASAALIVFSFADASVCGLVGLTIIAISECREAWLDAPSCRSVVGYYGGLRMIGIGPDDGAH